jgi:gliding motility-associated-like protein
MKLKSNATFCYLFSCIFFLTTSLISSAQVGQNNFKYKNPKPLGTTWLDVSFFDNNNGIAVGNASTIARTTDGGANWTYGVYMFNTATGFKQRPVLNDVHYVTPTIAYTVGDSGMLLKSIDGGANWTQLNNPLYANSRNINAVWFVNKDTGYIGGQAQNLNPTAANATSPEVSPKLYFTRNGGNTWDSIAAPLGPESWIGQVINTVNPPARVRVNAINKEIYRIQFSSPTNGYVIGSGNGTTNSYSQPFPGGSSTFPGNLAGLVWKFSNGSLIDYSISKERLGYSGIGVNSAPTATSTYNSTSFPQQSLKAMAIINDSTLVVTTFNNGFAVRINTGLRDSSIMTPFVALSTAPGTPTGSLANAVGRYEILQYSNPPFNLTLNQAPPPVIPAQVLVGSNMVNMAKAPNGNLYATSGNGQMAFSANNGTNWAMVQAIPASAPLITNTQLFATDVLPNGKIITMGSNGVFSTSTNGTTWTTPYTTFSQAGGMLNLNFADCNNGIITGFPGLLFATTDGGNTWQNRTVGSLASSFTTINGNSFPSPNNLYFGASNGNIYYSTDMGLSNNLIFIPDLSSQINAITTFGSGATTRIWATGYRFGAPVEKMVVYRSLNNGATWDTIKTFPYGGATNTPISSAIKFVTADIGYIGGGKGYVFKTTDGGTTWTNISPNPSLNSNTGFSSIHSLGVYDQNNLIYFNLIGTTRYMYKSTDGGATWSTNIYPITINNEPTTNINDFIYHDANNIVGFTGPNKIMISNDGGTTWRNEQAPSGSGFTSGAFVPKTVPAGTLMANRKMIVIGSQIFEYGSPLATAASTEEIVASCTNTNNGIITITTTGGIAPYQYKLDNGQFQSSNVFNGVSLGNHTITIKDQGCGPDVIKNITVGTRQSPTVSAGPDKVIITGDEVQLEGVGSSSYSVLWSPSQTLTGANTYNPIAKPTATTVYTITALDNVSNCTATSNTTVTVIPNCLAIKNAFSPNGDGINDRWVVSNGFSCINKIMVAVYNRYGNLVYKNDNYQNNWDGTYEGKPAPDGTYYYVITYNLINGKAQILKGDLTILR